MVFVRVLTVAGIVLLGACSGTSGTSPSGDAAGQGVRDRGQYCESNAECAEGLVCRATEYGEGGFDQCYDDYESFDCGVCLPPGKPLDYCDEDADCAGGLLCGFNSMPCNTICVSPPGGPCTPGSGDDECEDGALPCLEHVDGSGACLEVGTDGYLCGFMSDGSEVFCADGFVCNEALSKPVCQPAP